MKMNAEQKNLSYSLLLAAFLVLFLIGYFICMVPSLYVDYIMDDNLKSIREQHRTFVETGSYDDARVKNPTACFSVRIPYQGNTLFLSNKFFSMKITVTDQNLLDKLRQYQTRLYTVDQDDLSPVLGRQADTDQFLDQWKTLFQDIMPDSESLPVEIEFLTLQDPEIEYKNEYFRYHSISDNLVIIETGVEDTNNSYTNYIAAEKLDDALVLSLLPTVTPDMNEIRPVIFQSLPMLAATVIFLVLLFSRIYSRGIVAPQERLLEQSYRELEQKNQSLAEENKRMQIFLRASSHQLKTPVSAALLLVDGMIGKVGKYQDSRLYLPKVKEQLLSMRKMIEEILSINRLKEQLQIQPINLDDLLFLRLHACQITIADKKLSVTCPQRNCGEIWADERITSLILDNLLSNAVNYTPAGGKIEIRTSPGTIRIQNYGIRIPDDLLPHIFDPFVSGSHGGVGHGLGLYIASYYAPMTGASLSVANEGESVLAMLSFCSQKPCTDSSQCLP